MTFSASPLADPVQSRRLRATGLLLCIALYLWVRPYHGIRHDGLLYLGQTFMQSDPQGLVHDMFFAFGSQDSYSVVSWFLSLVYQASGVASGQFLVLLIAQVALLAAAYRWMARYVDPRELWVGFVLLIVMQRLYGGFAIFAFGERFVTARTFAEPLLLWSFVLVAERRWAWAAGTWSLGALAHPLMAIPVLAIVWVRGVMADRRVVWLLLGILPLLALGYFDVAPFSGLMRSYDVEWLRLIEKVNRQVLVAHWGTVDHMSLLTDCLVLATAHHYLPFRKPWWAAVVMVSGLLTMASLLLGDLAKNQLIIQLQLWRVHWIAHLLALLCLPAVFMALWRLQCSARVAAWALVASVIGANSRSDDMWPALIWAALWLLGGVRAWVPSRPALWKLGTAVSIAMVLIGSLQGLLVNLDALPGATLRTLGMQPALWILLVASIPVVTLPVTAVLLHGVVKLRRFYFLLLLLAVAGWAALGAREWDRRSDWTRYIETHAFTPHPWQGLIPIDAQVYWHPTSLPTWALLRRASYVSYEQGAGLLFNRGTAMTYKARSGALEKLAFQERICKLLVVLPGEAQESLNECFPTDDLVRSVCKAPQAPDFVIFNKRLSRAWLAEWTPTDVNGKPIQSVHLHGCAGYWQ